MMKGGMSFLDDLG